MYCTTVVWVAVAALVPITIATGTTTYIIEDVNRSAMRGTEIVDLGLHSVLRLGCFETKI